MIPVVSDSVLAHRWMATRLRAWKDVRTPGNYQGSSAGSIEACSWLTEVGDMPSSSYCPIGATVWRARRVVVLEW